MGLSIDQESFTAEDHERFSARLRASLTALEQLLARPGFGQGPSTIGAELEVSIVDDQARALPLEREQLPHVLDEHVTLELDRFNLEYNLTPLPAHGRPFSRLEAQLDRALVCLGEIVQPLGGRVVPIGILPTLQPADLEPHVMTDLPRYRALSAALRARRGSDFEIQINGEESLAHRCDDVTLEGAGTSMQVHLRVAPEDFAATYNAAQLATGAMLAVAANAPVFLERRLWRETRVALFQQAIDSRPPEYRVWNAPARVSFGQGWVADGAWELFAEAVSIFTPLLPIVGPEDPLACLRAGGTPELAELRLHQGTVWRWNRAIYDPVDDGHLRIELRALPSGPAPVDMAANAAWCLGLTMGLAPDMHHLLPAFPFRFARHNFHQAAQHGLDAELVWPAATAPSPRPHRARDLLRDLLPVAQRGLERLGVEADEISRHLGVIDERLARGLTPASWQLARLEHHERKHSRREALAHMLEDYLEGIASRAPITEWPACS